MGPLIEWCGKSIILLIKAISSVFVERKANSLFVDKLNIWESLIKLNISRDHGEYWRPAIRTFIKLIHLHLGESEGQVFSLNFRHSFKRYFEAIYPSFSPQNIY